MAGHAVGKHFERNGGWASGWGITLCQFGLECCTSGCFINQAFSAIEVALGRPHHAQLRAAGVDLVEPCQHLPPTQPRAANGKTWKRRWLAAVQVHAKPGSNSRDRFTQVLDGFKHEVKRAGVSLESISVLQADLRCMQSQK